MSFEDRERMREIGPLIDPVAEMLRRMIAEFDDEHYDACPSNDDSGPCNCFAGHLLADAKQVLEAAVAQLPPDRLRHEPEVTQNPNGTTTWTDNAGSETRPSVTPPDPKHSLDLGEDGMAQHREKVRR